MQMAWSILEVSECLIFANDCEKVAWFFDKGAVER